MKLDVLLMILVLQFIEVLDFFPVLEHAKRPYFDYQWNSVKHLKPPLRLLLG